MRQRLRSHEEKPWATATAREAEDKVSALGLEAVAILTEQPPLNAQLTAWGGALSLAAAARKAGLLTPDLEAIARQMQSAFEQEDSPTDEELAALFADDAAVDG